jgi:hypothetical protein
MTMHHSGFALVHHKTMDYGQKSGGLGGCSELQRLDLVSGLPHTIRDRADGFLH